MSDEVMSHRERAVGGTFCIIPYNHPDYSWTHHREWHAERYAVSTGEALDLMREHPEFRFCMEPWLDHVEPFLERCPERVEELRARLNSGQMGVKAFTLASPRPATCADETFIRNMTLGRRRYEAFAPGATLDVMACPDVAIGHSQMPQLVRLAGARLYRGWRSDTALNALGVPRDFRWRGLDGTEVMTSRGTYGGLVEGGLLPDDFAEHWEETVQRLTEEDFMIPGAMLSSQNRTWWLSQGMDDARPLRSWPHDRMMPWVELVREWNLREGSRMVFATPSGYAALLEEEELPVWDGVLDQVDVAYNSGWHGQRGLWRLRQELDAAAALAERACALARSAGYEAACPERLEGLWVEVCRVASHAQQWVFEKDWEELTVRARWSLRELREEADRAVWRLAGVGRASEAGRPLVLFNPLPVAREEVVEVPWVQPRQDAGGHRVVDLEGEEVALQLGEPCGESFGGGIVESPLVFRARVPALGVAVYRVEDGPVAEAPAAPAGDYLDLGGLRLRVSPRGLQELCDDRAGICWRAPAGSSIGDCRLLEMAEGILHVGPITGEIGGREGVGRWVCTGPIRWVYRWETEYHGQTVRQDIIADAGARHVDLVTRVLCTGANGHFALCFEPPVKGRMHVDIPFGVEERDLSGEPYASVLPDGFQNIERHRDKQMWARSWASVSDGERGVSVVTVDGDRYWTWDAEAGKLRHLLFTPLHDVSEGWEAWTTKDRLALGWHTFHHRVLLHEGSWREAGLCDESDRARLPLRPVKPLGAGEVDLVDGAAVRARLVGGVALRPAGVRLSALYEAEEGLVARVYESAGIETEAELVLPWRVGEVMQTDFNLSPTGQAPACDGRRVWVPLRPWEIATVVVKAAPADQADEAEYEELREE